MMAGRLLRQPAKREQLEAELSNLRYSTVRC
jgi:hypothetical protein